MNIAISSGHGKHVRGAAEYIDEVNEARNVVDAVARELIAGGVGVAVFHDNTSTTQEENLETIVDWHNEQDRDYDISVHFNAYQPTPDPMGTECCYLSQLELAEKLSTGIAKAGDLKNRGAKVRSDLYFLNKTNMPSVLIETCFVDSAADVDAYQMHFAEICAAIADVFILDDTEPTVESPVFEAKGKCSWFGGPEDTGVAPDEGLAFIYDVDDAPHLFLDAQPPGTTGLARRLDPDVFYVACRWDYDVTPKTMLAEKDKMALVIAGEQRLLAHPADWGPHGDTDRVADLSPGLLEALGLETDDEVEVLYPVKRRK